jgi:hypothetical protein
MCWPEMLYASEAQRVQTLTQVGVLPREGEAAAGGGALPSPEGALQEPAAGAAGAAAAGAAAVAAGGELEGPQPGAETDAEAAFAR